MGQMTVHQEADDWQPRPDSFTILVKVTGSEDMVYQRDYQQWLTELQNRIGAHGRAFNDEQPWAVGSMSSDPKTYEIYGHWTTDHFGHKVLDRTPYANVWQQIEGVASVAMAYVWAAIHLVQPLDEYGYKISTVHAELTDEMVCFG